MAGELNKMVNTEGKAELEPESEIKSSVLRIFAYMFMKYIGYKFVVFLSFYGFDARVIGPQIIR